MTTALAEPAPVTRTRSKVLAQYRKLSPEAGPADVWASLQRREAGFILLDARVPELYAQAHVPGAFNLPHRRINAQSTAGFPRNALIVTYCDGAGGNASAQAALKLAELGFAVKEMVGGLDEWRRGGLPLHGTNAGPGESCPVFCGC